MLSSENGPIFKKNRLFWEKLQKSALDAAKIPLNARLYLCEEKFFKVNTMTDKCDPDDPRRCHGTTPDGQCQYLAMEGSEFCQFHSGKRRGNKQFEQKKTERYIIENQELRQAYLRQKDDRDYLSMKDEINLVAGYLEIRLNAIRTDADKIMAVDAVDKLTKRLESMKINLLKLQQSLGMVLGKDEMRALAGHMAEILDEELEGVDKKEERMDAIVERLYHAIENAGKPAEEGI